MSKPYQIWASEGTEALVLASAFWNRTLPQEGEQLVVCFRASSWKRAKARFRRWQDARHKSRG